MRGTTQPRRGPGRPRGVHTRIIQTRTHVLGPVYSLALAQVRNLPPAQRGARPRAQLRGSFARDISRYVSVGSRHVQMLRCAGRSRVKMLFMSRDSRVMRAARS